MARPIKKKQIPNLQEAIKETAWNQIAREGAAALSLRAIARESKHYGTRDLQLLPLPR